MKKYILIVNDLERKILDGIYHPGAKLPSVRHAAKQYHCSMSTVIRAYAELEKRHVIYSVPQSGFYIVERLREDVRSTANQTIDFTAASPDINLFPYLDFQHCLNQAIDTYKYHLFTYGESQGLASLRFTLSKHLAEDQVFAKAEQIVVTSGVQQALEILAKMPFPNEKSGILVEQPSYNNYLRFLEREGLPVYTIKRTSKGIDLLQLEQILQTENIKLFYTMSRCHNPLGTSYQKAERKAIAKMASKYDVYIVEDDYVADLEEVKRLDPIYAYNATGHVIYLKSFSKIIFPGIRLGATVLPVSLLDLFCSYKSYNTSLLSQAALDVYIKNGMYARHKQKIGNQYAERMHFLQESIQRYNQDGMIQAADVQSGVYCQIRLPSRVNLERLVKRLRNRKVKVVSGKIFYLSYYREQTKFLRISIARVEKERIDVGVKTIVEEVKRGEW